MMCLKGLYAEVNSCVRVSHDDLFECRNGWDKAACVAQCFSPFLISELAKEILVKGKMEFSCHRMLFADGTVLLPVGLKKQINLLIMFTESYNMKLNMAKTKIVVFRKGGHLAKNEFWTFGETAIEVVNTYKYLGLCFSAK